MDLRELRYFVVLAEEQHFGRAAERLYIAQSGLSKTIQRAEAELGVELFTRAHRQVELTPAGATLFKHAEEVIRAFEKVGSTAAAVRDGTVGKLSLATSPVARYNVVAPILERFTTTWPEVHLNRREQLAGALEEDLLAGVLDIGITFCTPPREGLVYEPLREADVRVLLSSSHPLAKCQRIGLRELRGERFLMSASGSLARYGYAFEAAGFEPASVPDALDYDEDLQEVQRGRGVVLSARTFLADPPPGITMLELDPPTRTPIGIVRRAGEPAAVIAHFTEFAGQISIDQGWLNP